MAAMPARFRSFKDDPQLRSFYLNNVTATGKTLGIGSYGSVLEIKYEETLCAAKQMHELLLQAGNQGVQDIIGKYRQECQLMAGLRHPNITQFLGLCILEDSNLPLLVMERLEMSVDDLLECSPNIPLAVKVSILTDTSSGLVYLHGRAPPIVHRDLTARNILLTSSLCAKLTDLGNSRMVNFRPGQLAQTLTKTPGTTVYMPPEALSESHRYGPSLDVFSFGHLALFTLTQVFPGELLSSTYPNPSNPDKLIARSEVDRRQTYMATLETTCGASHPVLLDLVRQCLHNTPERRPSSQDLLARLRGVKSQVEGIYGGGTMRQLNIASVLYVKEMKNKDKQILELKTSEGKTAADNTELMTSIERIENEIRLLRADLLRVKQESREKDNVIDGLEQKNRDQHIAMERLERDNRETQIKLEKLEQENREYSQINYKKLQNIQSMGSQKANMTETSKETFLLKLDWRRGPDMPVAMTEYIQSVAINNDTVYVGGGVTDRGEDDYIVMAYNTQSCQWHTLPPYSTRLFAMTTINNKLVVVGGCNKDHPESDKLGEWQPNSNQWTRPFPPMSTSRSRPSATSYKHWLVVAGGFHGVCFQASVEVLDVSNMQWSTGPSTPKPWKSMKSTTIGNTWYITGGLYKDVGWIPDIYSVSLDALVSHSSSGSSNIWNKLPSLNCDRSCPLNIGGSLLAVGGWDNKNGKSVSTIQRYVPETNTWVQAGQLPHAVFTCTCIMTSDKFHVMGGYDGMNMSKEILTSIVKL